MAMSLGATMAWQGRSADLYVAPTQWSPSNWTGASRAALALPDKDRT
jgi:hypothetical protein